MKIINGKELGFMPNGTVFSEIIDAEFDPEDAKYGIDATINGLHIMCGHDDYFPPSSGKFNGVVHMLDHVSCFNKEVNTTIDDWTDSYDTDFNDYDERQHFVIYEKEEIEGIIKNLQWALDEYKEDK